MGFLRTPVDTLPMLQRPLNGWSKGSGSIVCSVLLALAASSSLFADSSTRLGNSSVGGCYCCCGEARTPAGCVKICELPKYASRWWATSCAKPRLHRPAEDSNAGPHLRRPDRATYAELPANDR